MSDDPPRDELITRLESVIEQYEVSQEELKASNEELQSTNEELRSTVEELERSKEELQCTNEELRRWEAESSLRSSERGMRMALDAAEMGTWWWDEDSGASGGDARAYEILKASPDEGGFADVLAERLAEPDRRRWWDYMRIGRERDVAFELADAAGSVHVQLDAVDVDGSGSDASASRRGTISDVTADTRLLQALDERTRRLTLLADAAAQLLRGSPPEALLTELFAEMSDLLGLEIYERFEIDETGAPCRVEGNVDWSASSGDEPNGVDIGPAYCARALETGAPVVVTDLDRTSGAEHARERREGLTAYGCFPLITADEVLGALSFATRGPARFERESIELIRTIVDYLAVAEFRLRTEAQLREMNEMLETRVHEATTELRESEAHLRMLASDLVRAEHEERRRIGDMLHDDVQQLLFGAQMRLELLREDVAEGRLTDLEAHVDETDRYIAESIDKTRYLTVELAPPSLDDDDLAETIHSLVTHVSEIHGLDVDVTIESPLRVPDRTVRVVVHQTIRELLFNVVKHSDVRHANVDVTIKEGELDLHVSDGGKGFDTDKILNDKTRAGRGLATLRQRLSVVGGSLSIESIPGDGTNVRVRLPAERRSEVAADG